MRKYTWVVLCFALLFVGCGQFEGDQGPQGPKGDPGTPGAMILVDAGAPDAADGIIGDVYIDTLNGTIYGPKTAEGWGEPSGSIKGEPGAPGADGLPGITGPPGPKGDTGAVGATGEPGADGNWIWSGWGYPQDSLGHPGDYYIDVKCWNFYGPKVGAEWGNPIGKVKFDRD